MNKIFIKKFNIFDFVCLDNIFIYTKTREKTIFKLYNRSSIN